MDEQVIEVLKAIEPDAFSTELNKALPDHFKAIFNKGHQKATALVGADLETEKTASKAKDAKIAELEASLKEAQESNPEVEKIQAKYQQALAAKDERIKQIESERDKTKADYASRFEAKSLETFSKDLQSYLGQYTKSGDIARILAADPSIRNRLKMQDGDIVSALQSDGVTDLPLEGVSSIAEAIGREIVSGLSSDLLKDRRQGGSDYGRPGTNGAAVTISKADAADHSKWKAAAARAEKMGTQVQIVQ